MRENVYLLEERFSAEGEEYVLQIDGTLDDEIASFNLLIRLMDGKGLVVTATLQGNVVNPLITTGAVVGAVGYFAWCVGSKLTGTLGQYAYDAYAGSVKDNPSLSRGARVRDILARMKARASSLPGNTVKIILGCLIPSKP
jgi:hypothetical protein